MMMMMMMMIKRMRTKIEKIIDEKMMRGQMIALLWLLVWQNSKNVN